MFAGYADYYDLLYSDKDYVAEANYLASLINRFGRGTGKKVLELGCGTGRHAVELARLGHYVLGVDTSLSMLKYASARANSGSNNEMLSFEHGDIRTFRASAPFDCVLACFHVVNYQLTDDDLERSFVTAARNLRPGGIFVFDSWFGPAVLAQRPEVRVKRVSQGDIEVTRIAEPTLMSEENIVSVLYTLWVHDIKSSKIQMFSEAHRIRFLFKPEIERLCKNAGLTLVNTEEWLTAKPAGLESWGVSFVACH